jgi:hypothetical protein
MDALGNEVANYFHFKICKKFSAQDNNFFKIQVLKFLQYKDQDPCLFSSTYIMIKWSAKTRIIPQISFLQNPYHMYCWAHIKTLKSRVDTLTTLFPTDILHTFLLTRTDVTWPHRLIFLSYIPLKTSVVRKNCCSFSSCTFLHRPAVHTTFPTISNSQHSAVEHPESTCDLRLSPWCYWRNSDFGL